MLPLIFTNSKEFNNIYHNLTLKLYLKKAVNIDSSKSNHYVLK